MEPNYDAYSEDQLIQALRVIDKNEDPDRYFQINQLLVTKFMHAASEESVNLSTPQRKLHSPTQTFVGTYWGGPLYGIYVVRKNFLEMNKPADAKKTLELGMAFLFLLLFLVPFLPDSFPNLAIPIAYSLAATQLVKRHQLDKDAIMHSKEYTFESNWKIFGIGALSLVTFLAVTFAIRYAMGALGLLPIAQ